MVLVVVSSDRVIFRGIVLCMLRWPVQYLFAFYDREMYGTLSRLREVITLNSCMRGLSKVEFRYETNL